MPFQRQSLRLPILVGVCALLAQLLPQPVVEKPVTRLERYYEVECDFTERLVHCLRMRSY